MSDKCICCLCLIFLTMRCLSAESCAKLKFITPVNNNFKIPDKDALNLTFNLNMENCVEHSYTLTIETFQKHGAEVHYKIILNKTSCTVTDNSDQQCRCRNKHVVFWKKVEEAGDVTYTWRWFAAGSNTTLSRGERSLKFRFSQHQEETEHLLYVKGSGIGLFVASLIFVLIFSYKRKRPSSLNACFRSQ